MKRTSQHLGPGHITIVFGPVVCSSCLLLLLVLLHHLILSILHFVVLLLLLLLLLSIPLLLDLFEYEFPVVVHHNQAYTLPPPSVAAAPLPAPPGRTAVAADADADLITPNIHLHGLLVTKDVVKLLINKNVPSNRLPQNFILSALDSQQLCI